jgi:hypothetical protein
MRQTNLPLLVVITAFVLTVSAGCGPAVVANTPVPTNEAVQVSSTPTETVQEVRSQFEQTKKSYVHKSGAFELPALNGWKAEETEEGVTFLAPEPGMQIRINVTNTGVEYMHSALEVFAFNTEDALYVHKDKYQLLNIQSDPEAHKVVMEKTFSSEGKPYYNYSVFQQEGAAVYMIELTAQTEDQQELADAFSAVAESVKYHSDKAAALPMYQFTRAYTVPGDHYSIQVPVAWFFDSTSPDADTMLETFTSPDELGLIQTISFTNKVNWDATTMRQAAIVQLNKYYPNGAGNINITTASGNRLDWTSIRGGFSGSTYYEAHGKQLVVLTLSYESEEAELYQPLIKQIAETYQLP